MTEPRPSPTGSSAPAPAPAPTPAASTSGSGGRRSAKASGNGGGGRPPIIAPIIALIGLIAITAGSLFVIQYLGLTDKSTADAPTSTPFVDVVVPSGATPQSIAPEVTPTPTPHATSVATPPPDKTAKFPGMIVLAKEGDLYIATNEGAPQLIKGAGSSKESVSNGYPTWTPDGKRIVYIQTKTKEVNAPSEGDPRGKLAKYTFYYPNIMSISPDGGDPKLIYSSLFPLGGGQWHRWVLQPDVSPDGQTIALVTDGQDGVGDVVLGTISIKGTNLKQIPNVPEVDAQGHNDPAWSPDGKKIAFTYDNRSGNVGTPKIGIWNAKTGKTALITKQGYANPSWSPDGLVLAAERTTGTGRDIVILDPASGAEIVRLTNDGDSFSPAFSPNGDQIAFLRRKGLGVDLWIMDIDPGKGYTRGAVKAVTQDGSLDAESPPAWYIPEDQRKPLITPPPDLTFAPEPSDGGDAAASVSPAP
ncbi:MAG: hypothetical protein U0869_13595 [Chloroflexota bacterium]